MSIVDYSSQLNTLYGRYNNEVKPLLAEVEACYESIPLQLYNEIRAFNDHIARCYFLDEDQKLADELQKADGHITRIVLDCFKFLNVWYYEAYVETFTRDTRGVDLTTINNGQFHNDYNRISLQAKKYVKEAKKNESYDKGLAFANYQFAFIEYNSLEELVEANRGNIKWARARFHMNKVAAIILFVVTSIVSAIIGYYCNGILEKANGKEVKTVNQTTLPERDTTLVDVDTLVHN